MSVPEMPDIIRLRSLLEGRRGHKMSEPAQVSRPMRADAQRNYARLLNTAREAVSAHGADIVLEDIARSAGVAIGTLYRHFPTRQDLLEAVFLDEANALKVRAEELANTNNPTDALIEWLHLQINFGARGHSMGAAVMAAKHVPGTKIYEANMNMFKAGAVLLQRAQATGQIRTDVDGLDIMRLIYGIAMVNEHASDPDGVKRMLAIVVAGIRTQSRQD
jgi:AcrR family transcriptional regulator